MAAASPHSSFSGSQDHFSSSSSSRIERAFGELHLHQRSSTSSSSDVAGIERRGSPSNEAAFGRRHSISPNDRRKSESSSSKDSVIQLQDPPLEPPVIRTNISEETRAAKKHKKVKPTKPSTILDSNPEEKDACLVLLVFLLESILFSALLLAAYFLRFQKDMFHPYFFPLISCTDPQYSYPYLKDADETNNNNIHISQTAYYCVVILCPLFAITLGELLYHFLSEEKARTLHIKTFKITTMPRRTLRFSAVFLIGIFVTSIITDSLKLVAARPRPHFLTVCEPDLSLCNKHPISSESICTGADTAAILEARMSFPSFYCSCTMYVAVYMAIYIHMILDLNAIYTLRPMFVGACAILGFMGGYTRYQLNYLHWEDMIIGYLIGAGVAVYLAYYMAYNFKERDPKKVIVYHKVVPDLKIAMMKRYRSANADYQKYDENRPFTNLPNINIVKSQANQHYTQPRTSRFVSESDRRLAMDDPELPRRDSEEHYNAFDKPDHSSNSAC